MQGEKEAIMRLAPAGSGTGEINANNDVTVGTSSVAAQPIPNAGAGCWVTVKVRGAAATDVIFVRFGSASVAPATTSDSPFFHGSVEDYWCGPGVTHYTAIATSAACHLGVHRSSV